MDRVGGICMRTALLVVATIVALGAFSLERGAPASYARQATPEAAAPVVISSELFASSFPAIVENPELALARVTIMPGAAIPTHFHSGTQIGAVVQGELTYTVFTGEVDWFHADQPGSPAEMISPGETVTVLAGDALVESPGSIHQGRNTGTVPIIIYLSTLFPAGSPRSTLAEATPAP